MNGFQSQASGRIWAYLKVNVPDTQLPIYFRCFIEHLMKETRLDNDFYGNSSADNKRDCLPSLVIDLSC